LSLLADESDRGSPARGPEGGRVRVAAMRVPRQSLFGAAVLVWRGGPCLARRSLFGAAVLVWRGGPCLAQRSLFGVTALYRSHTRIFFGRKAGQIGAVCR
jgi:hypothetical protein